MAESLTRYERLYLNAQYIAFVRAHALFAAAFARQVTVSARKTVKKQTHDHSDYTTLSPGRAGHQSKGTSVGSGIREGAKVVLMNTVHEDALRARIFRRVRDVTKAEWAQQAEAKDISKLGGFSTLFAAQLYCVGPSAILAAFRTLHDEHNMRAEEAKDVLLDCARMCLPERYIGLYLSKTVADLQTSGAVVAFFRVFARIQELRQEFRPFTDSPEYMSAPSTLRHGHPLEAIARSAHSLAHVRNGGWVIGTEEPNSMGVFEADLVVRVRKCFFADFFARHGEPSLTSLFCAAELDLGKRVEDLCADRVKITCPQTIADGYTSCVFRFKSRVREDEKEPAT